MRTRLVALTLGALGSFAYACSSSAPNPYAQVSEYCAAYAQAVCQIGTTSCQFDVSACQTYQAGQCTTAATAAQKTRAYTSTNVKACLDAIDAAYGGGPPSIPASALNNINSTCALVFLGTSGNNAACQTTQDCAVSGQICATAPGQTSKCATPTPKALGDQCFDTGDQCPTGAYCSSQQGSANFGTCVAGGGAGASCGTTTPCDNADHCIGGVCQPLAAIGQDCCSSADCASSNYCDLYTDSNAPTPTCVDKLNGFGRGGVDCLGIAGQTTSGCSSGSSSGGGSDGGSGSGGDGGGGDAPTGD